MKKLLLCLCGVAAFGSVGLAGVGYSGIVGSINWPPGFAISNSNHR